MLCDGDDCDVSSSTNSGADDGTDIMLQEVHALIHSTRDVAVMARSPAEAHLFGLVHFLLPDVKLNCV